MKTVLVALMAEKAEVRYDPAYIMPSQIASKITALGYPASVLEGEQDGRATVEVQVGCEGCTNALRSRFCVDHVLVMTCAISSWGLSSRFPTSCPTGQ